MTNTTEVPNSDGTGSAPSTTPLPGGSGASESVEQLQKRLNGAISQLDKLRTENDAKVATVTKEKEELQAQLKKSQDELIAATVNKDLTAKQLTDLQVAHGEAAAELARWGVLSEPWMLQWREFLPKTTDQALLEAAVVKLKTTRMGDISAQLNAQKDSFLSQPPAPAPPKGPRTKEAIQMDLVENAGNPEKMKVLYTEWDQHVRSQK